MNNDHKKKTLPAIVSKAALCEIFGFTRSYDLKKKKIITSEWLEVLGIDEGYYNQSNEFTPEESTQIKAMLRIRKLID